jgi:hypothetical protein
VEAGEPATGVYPAALVYFVKDGRMVALPRRTGAPVDVRTALMMLVKGVSGPEEGRGITSGLPPWGEVPGVREEDGRVWIEISAKLGRLPATALDQLVCTAAAARLTEVPGGPPVEVVVTNSAGWQAVGSGEECPGL